MKHLFFLLLSLLFLCALAAGCGAKAKKKTEPPAIEKEEFKEIFEEDALSIILHTEARGQFDPKLRSLLGSPSPKVRARLARALGRIPGPEGISMLRGLIGDKESAVRKNAAFASGKTGLGKDTGAPLYTALVARLSVSSAPEETALIIDAMSELRQDAETARALSRYAKDEHAAVRSAAARALKRFGDADALCRLTGDADPRVKKTAAALLSQMPDMEEEAFCRDNLVRLLDEPSAETRIQAARALAVQGGPTTEIWEKIATDEDERVFINALTALAALRAEARCKAIRAAFSVLSKKPENHSARLLGAAFDAAIEESCRADIVKDTAQAAVPFLENKSDARWSVRAACAAKTILGANDIEILGCDPASSTLGKKYLIAQMRASAKDKASRDLLLSFLRDDDPRVALAALRAVAASGDEASVQTVIKTLSDQRILLQVGALNEIRQNPEQYLARTAEDKSIELPAELKNALSDIFNRHKDFDQAFLPLKSLANTLGALGDTSTEPLLTALIRDTRIPVRKAAENAFAEIPGLSPPIGLPHLTLSPDAAMAFPVMPQAEHTTAVLHFSSGNMTAELFQDKTPLAVAAFVHAARSGLYNDTPVYRVEPGRAVFFGDPSGAGLEGTGWYTPSETAPVKIEKGSVVMVDAFSPVSDGRFFIALCEMPELSGAATVIGRVRTGLELSDQLIEGDRLVKALISQVSKD